MGEPFFFPINFSQPKTLIFDWRLVEERPRFMKLVGKWSSGKRDISEKHDEYLAEDTYARKVRK